MNESLRPGPSTGPQHLASPIHEQLAPGHGGHGPSEPFDPAANEPQRALGSRAPAPSTTLPVGYRLFEYRIDAVLGQGGFGVAYEATDANLNTRFVIKEYLPQDLVYRAADYSICARDDRDQGFYQVGLDHFLAEARTLATFRHPNIVRVARFFEANSTAYMVLEFEDGEPLADWRINNGFLTEARLVALFAPLLDGLAVVHHSGYVHGDVKPDNILVRRDDGNLVLLDFGAARQIAAGLDETGDLVTPGYAALEQYAGGGRPGAWTDVYGVAATLFWAVTGRKPEDAPDRLDDPDLMPSAESLCRGRYSQSFLRAIDWGLKIPPEERPQNIRDFRMALFSSHPTVLALQEALEKEDEGQRDDSTSTFMLRPKASLRSRLERFAHSFLQPRSWPIVIKMTVAMVASAIIPMVITALYNFDRAQEHAANMERRSLEQLAVNAAGRIAQLLDDSRNLANYVWTDDDFRGYLAGPTASGSQQMLAKLKGLVGANPDLQFAMIMDPKGTALVSTDPNVTGRNFKFRDYFKAAIQGEAYMTGIIVGSVAGEPGTFYSRPVRGPDGTVLGVVVLRIRANSVGRILSTSAIDGRTPFLVDSDGVIVWHPSRPVMFKSLVPLDEETLEEIRIDQRFRRSTIESINQPELATVMVGTRQQGNVSYVSRVSGQPEIAGYAPVPGYDWVVGVSESREAFVAPLERLLYSVLGSVVLVGLVFLLLAWLLARAIMQPIKDLTTSIHALKRGEYDTAHVQVRTNDEIGRLGRTFNVMIDVLRQRERERMRTRTAH